MFWPIHRQSSALPDKLALPGQVYLSASVSVVVKGDLLNLQTNNVFLTKPSQQWIKHCGFLRGRVFYDVSLSPNLHDKHFTHHSIITVWNAPHQREILSFFRWTSDTFGALAVALPLCVSTYCPGYSFTSTEWILKYLPQMLKWREVGERW